MCRIVGRVVETQGPPRSLFVVFTAGEREIARHPVVSRHGGEALIERLLPTLQGMENDDI